MCDILYVRSVGMNLLDVISLRSIVWWMRRGLGSGSHKYGVQAGSDLASVARMRNFQYFLDFGKR